MAGLGEACAHVPAVLFYLETTPCIDGMSFYKGAVSLHYSSLSKEIRYFSICKINFSSPKSKKKLIQYSRTAHNSHLAC